MKRKILILSNEEEGAVELVTKHLRTMGESFFRFNTDTFPQNKTLTTTLSNGKILGSLTNLNQDTHNNVLIDSENIKSVWYRRPAPPKIRKGVREDLREFCWNESRATLWSFYTTIDAFWVNPPLLAVKLLEDNKLYQLKGAQIIGLNVPQTIISNNFEDILSFSSNHKYMAIKPLYTTVFRKKNKDLLFLYTNRITQKEILDKKEELALCPIMLQEYINKKVELRITIVGNNIFACAIHSQDSNQTLHDWRRYSSSGVKHEQYELPNCIKLELLKLMNMFGLFYAAIDMIITPDEKYVFLEINPSGQWGWIEKLTGMKISQAIAKLLAQPS
ncbi:MAG TPA: hypothetical protein ENI63_02280 [Candidatus Kaiserbacteria bacterium]|nr:hypothetical protein [Candidatus Kaiserbacteria bacterium]